MKVKSLLAQAARCKSEDDAKKLLGTLARVFGNAKPLAHLPQANAEAYMEDGQPFVRYELNQEISNDYITIIRPEIRGGKLVVSVVTNRMLDRLGMCSQEWEVVDDCDDTIEPFEDQTIASVAESAKQVAIANHASLIESVGVATTVAREAAEKSW